jgi:hypothetical protein
MKEAVGVVQTSWPEIQIILYRRDDGQFQFFEEGPCRHEDGGEERIDYHESGLYADVETAKAEMIKYAVIAEDDRKIDPRSVIILDPSEFKL